MGGSFSGTALLLGPAQHWPLAQGALWDNLTQIERWIATGPFQESYMLLRSLCQDEILQNHPTEVFGSEAAGP